MSENINDLYSLVKKEKDFVKYTLGVKPYVPVLTEDNLTDGFITRYFARYVPASSITITEVNEPSYKNIKKNPLYQTIEVVWKIKGKLYDFVVNPDCCGNREIIIVEQTGQRKVVTPQQFNSIPKKVEDKVIANGYIIGFGTQTENRKAIEYADLTMPGLRRYITNYTEFWQGT
jgi:hypothetical protein